jgi:sirohydrochlorin ferrochelatase
MTTGLLVVDHGSRRAASNDQLGEVAAMVRNLRPDALVHEAHMELTEPSIRTAFDRLVADGAKEVVVLLYFLSNGRHVQEDVPALVAEAAAAHPGVEWRIGRALGPTEDLAHLLLKRADLSPART